MPRNKDSFSFEHVFRFNDDFFRVLPLMSDFRYHIINIERLAQVIFIVRIRHSSEIDRHHRSTLNIPKFIEPRACVAISIEELCNSCFVLREIGVVKTLIVLLMIVNHMPCLRREQRMNLLVFQQSVKKPNLV